MDKKTVIDRLLPLTKKYYNRIHHIGCGKIYWQGSHHHEMTVQLERILDKTRGRWRLSQDLPMPDQARNAGGGEV